MTIHETAVGVTTADAPLLTSRERLLSAAVRVFARLGYDRATIADIVREARVSRRTFYEQFHDKQDCLFAAYDASSEVLVTSVSDAASQKAGWQGVLTSGVARFVDVMMFNKDATRVLLVEMMSGGAEAVARRRRAHRQWAIMLMSVIEKVREHDQAARQLSRPISLTTAQVLVAAALELILLALEETDESQEPDQAALRHDVRQLILGFVIDQSDMFAAELDRLDQEREIA